MLSIFKKEAPAITESISNIKELIREGNDYFSGELIILDEQIAGNLFCAEKVSIEPRGVLNGNITSKLCVVSGAVNGDILSLDMLDIKSTAIVRGNIQSAAVHIEPGAVINGHITVGEDIESLTVQWNKTKFSTDDDHLSAKLAKELFELNNAGNAVNIVVKKEIKAAPAVITQEIKAAPLAASQPEVKPEPVKAAETAPAPALAAAQPQKVKETEAENTRWW